MLSQETLGPRGDRIPCVALVCCLALAGCKSDLNQQLLERELRYQEDQIYQLQDDLQDKCARLDSVAVENASLRRQLGVTEADPLKGSRAGRSRPAAVPAPVAVPPAIEIPEAIRAPAAAPRGGLAPPALDNIPPLPATPTSTTDPSPLSLPAPSGAAAPPATPVAVPVSYDQPLSDGRPVRLVVTTTTTGCFDDNGDGRSDGINVTFEPRDADEKLVAAQAAVSITVFDAADPATPLATWTIPAEQAAARFRRTTRLRGMHFPLRWTAAPPAGDHVRVIVRMTGADGMALEGDATITATAVRAETR
ncbi:MAG: hypothetical protein K8S94_13735 [Planctomycetia bacterium]|nr:hypothetical protein [Planctomycetia bacterium]